MNLRYTTPSGTSVTLNQVRITGFNVENQFDGDAFNRSGRRETISGTAIISGNPLTSSTGAIDVIRNSLNAPRGKLEVQFDTATGTWYTLVDGRGGSSQTPADARNGPIPTVSVSRIEGTHSAAVTFVSFSYTYFGCGDTRIQKFEMSVTQSLDETGFITMTRTGSIRVAAGLGAGGTSVYTNASPQIIPTVSNVDVGPSPDLYRNLVSGRPGPFFRRVRQDYTLDSSLTTLSFTIEDRMVFRELKYPVMMGDASFGYERALGGISMLGTKTFTAQFEGGPDTAPADLLKVAVEAAAARIDFVNDLVQSISVREPNIFTRNRIELTVTAVGQSDAPVDLSVVKAMFTDPHSGGTTRYVSAYGSGGVYVNTANGLKWDACQVPSIISTIVAENPDSGSQTESTLTVLTAPSDADLESTDGTSIEVEPVQVDSLNPSDNRIKHLDGQQDINTEDSGIRYLEAMGGAVQWPMQIRMPQVVITQTVKYISNTESAPIPYPSVDDPFVVLTERISVNNAPPDVTGKPVFAVVATRQIQVQTSSSLNTRLVGESMPRRVWSPQSVQQARGLYTSGNAINNLQITDAGGEVQADYSSS